MALTDAVTASIGTLLLILFGGASNTITTNITIPICSPDEAAKLVTKYRKQGAVKLAHPVYSFILDDNEELSRYGQDFFLSIWQTTLLTVGYFS
ncbi:hypothetical protein MKW98_026064 [Papaver atlanticum]|uniref:Uncharacterized protein n=1 Tax=Papaver atlanticum TaxID=357466 RepID=A0AAD4RYD9_9MAGN|nr:hypothetical protein MKW98_026064 [Papaver atlanticum]